MAYEETCDVKNTNNGITVKAEILDFKYRKSLTVSINRSIKVVMMYNNTLYVGNMAGMEFTSEGPKEITTYKGRR